MKKMFCSFLLLLGLCVFSTSKSEATKFYTSNSTGVVVITSATDTSGAGGTTDITEVWLSTGYNDGTYFVCASSDIPGSFAVGNSTTNLVFSKFTPDQYVFPPIPFATSTGTVNGTGNIITNSAMKIDLRDSIGDGFTLDQDGLVCFIQGPGAGRDRYIWTLRLDQPRLRRR